LRLNLSRKATAGYDPGVGASPMFIPVSGVPEIILRLAIDANVMASSDSGARKDPHERDAPDAISTNGKMRGGRKDTMNELQESVLRKTAWRLVPILTLAYIVKHAGYSELELTPVTPRLSL
jgi:hypothetical protein